MKKIVLILLFPLLSIGQTQIGADIDGKAANDLFGISVAISADGTTIASGGSGGNRVAVYHNTDGIWNQVGDDIEAEITDDATGWSVALSADGLTVAIGSPENNINGASSGCVRVFHNTNNIWVQVGTGIYGEAVADRSGNSVSISADGSVLAIGTSVNDGNGTDAGSVRVYKNVSGIWTQIGSDIDGEATEDYSGYSVSLSNDGTIVAIGAAANDGNGIDSGSVRVYQNISGSWTQIGADIDGEADFDYSGYSVSLSNDGTIVAIGANQNDGNGIDSGSVRVYQNISGIWTQIGGDIDGEAPEDSSGYSVSLSGDGTVLAIGASRNDENGSDSGSVRVYQNISGIWTKIGVDIDGEAAGDWSGYRISLSDNGNTLAIGAHMNAGNGEASGQVRVYDLSAVLSSDSFVLAHFSVYPNPASEIVTISLEEGLIFEKVNVYNTLGQLVKTENRNVIAVNSLAKGSYFFEVITNKGKAAKQIIVQ